MHRLRHDESGFGAVEATIIVIIVAIIGVAGWFIWGNQRSTDTSPAAANNTIQTTVSNTSTETNTTSKQVDYFEINELGVKFELPDSLKELYYYIGNNGRTAYFSLENLKTTDCAADKTAQIALTRYTDADYDEDVQAAASKDSAKKIGSYYFSIAGGQAFCSEDNDIQDRASNMKQEIVKILPASLVSQQ